MPIGEPYIANDVYLDDEKQQIIIITGPNMAGKSALLRQTALITLMSQIGCFVPAECAHIGIVDKIFTRVGASDNISVGESTFMVEMNEASDILNNMSSRSLVLFDELGAEQVHTMVFLLPGRLSNISTNIPMPVRRRCLLRITMN